MPRSKVTDKQRDEIIALRQNRTKWTQIQRVTKIDRRTAKNIYENWERNSSVEELRKVRKEVAGIEFRTHMESIVKLAESLVSNLDVLPRSIDDISKSGEEFLGWLWNQDLLQRYSPSNPQLNDYKIDNSLSFRIGDPRIYLEEKKLLYKSLRAHTQREVQWNILDNDWKNARDKYAKCVPQFLEDASKLVSNYFKNVNEPGFLERIKRASQELDPAKNMARLIVNGIWWPILQGNLKAEPLFETVSKERNTIDVILKFRDGTSGFVFRLFDTDRQYMADKITRQCNSAIRIISEQDIVRELRVQVDNIRRASNTLREMLNPLKLRPMILRTHCDLCPVL